MATKTKKPRKKKMKDIDLRVRAMRKRAKREKRPLIDIMVEVRKDMRRNEDGRVEFLNHNGEWVGIAP